jgi:peroxiredoxin
MLEKQEKTIVTLAISVSAIILIGVVIWRVAFFIPAPRLQTDHYHYEHLSSEPIAEVPAAYKLTLNDVIRAARTWQPAHTYWFGQKAPDFTLTDVNGKKHSLSDYRGKNVLIVFWATWCRPCHAEIPHLIALRNIIGEDKLAILAISYITTRPYETAETAKNFAKQSKINYTVFSADAGAMPSPFSRISAIPCSFFIDKHGRIKLATEGMLSLGEIKAILRAE